MLKKRGQLTLFIIIGVLIISFIIIGYYGVSAFKQKTNKAYFTGEKASSELDNLKNVIDSCVNDLSLNSIYVIGDQGGFYLSPKRYYKINEEDNMTYGEFISYHFYNGEIVTIELTDMENHMSGYIEDNFKSCLRENSNDFFKIETNPKPTVKIQPGIVNFDFNGDITLSSKEGHTMKIDLEDYKESFQVNLYGIQEIAKYLAESHFEDETLYCLSCLVAMLEERNLYLDYYTLDNNNVIVAITDRTNEIPEDYYFIYLNQYTGKEESKILNEVSTTAPEMPSPGE
jgi:hypothetical protein